MITCWKPYHIITDFEVSFCCFTLNIPIYFGFLEYVSLQSRARLSNFRVRNNNFQGKPNIPLSSPFGIWSAHQSLLDVLWRQIHKNLNQEWSIYLANLASLFQNCVLNMKCFCARAAKYAEQPRKYLQWWTQVVCVSSEMAWRRRYLPFKMWEDPLWSKCLPQYSIAVCACRATSNQKSDACTKGL